MAKQKKLPNPKEPERIFTTGNEGLGNDIATLNGIFQGEYDPYQAEVQLRRVAHNLGRLRNLLIESTG